MPSLSSILHISEFKDLSSLLEARQCNVSQGRDVAYGTELTRSFGAARENAILIPLLLPTSFMPKVASSLFPLSFGEWRG